MSLTFRLYAPFGSAAALALLLGPTACGDSSLFGGPPPPGGTASGSVTTSGGGTAAGVGGTGGVGGDHPGGGAVGGTGGTGPQGGGKPTLVDCGDTSCPAGPDAACCWDQYLAYGEPRGECVTGAIDADDCTTSQTGEGWETRIECQRPSDCPGASVCCADWKQGWYQGQQYAYYEDLTCVPSCDFPSLLICDSSVSPTPTDGCPVIPDGQGGTVQSICKPSQLLPPGYTICGRP